MSDIVSDLPQIAPGANLEQVVDFLQRLRAYVQAREPLADTIGDPLEKMLLRRELVDLQLLRYGAAGLTAGTGSGGSAVGTPGPPGPPGDPYVPDLTAPPTPANLQAVSLLRGAYFTIDPPTYTVGHGNAWTNWYVAQYSGTGPLPTAANAVKVGQSAGATTMYVHAAPIGAQLHVWAEHVTVDGMPSAAWAGGINGVQVTIGKIGNADMGELIIQAENLANGSITPRTLAVNIGGGNLSYNSSFTRDSDGDGLSDGWGPYGAPGMTWSRVAGRTDGAAQRVTWTGASVSNHGLTQGGYPWRQNTDYIVSFYARGTGSISGGTPDLMWNNNPSTQAALLNPPITGSVWQRYAFRIRWDGVPTEASSIYFGFWVGYPDGALDIDDVQVEEGNVLTAYAPRPDEILPGTITATEIADDSITTPKLVARAVVASKIAAAAIQAEHMLIAPKSLIVDSSFASGSAGWANFIARYPATNPVVPAGCPAEYAAVFNGRDGVAAARIAVVAGEQYRVTGWVNRNGALPNTGFLMLGYAADGSHIQTSVFGVGTPFGWTRVDSGFAVAPGVASVSVGPWNEQPHGGGIESWFADLQVEKKNDFALIVDGAILAQHLAANSIAVGTAAVQNGAIVNAMIGNAAIDDAKIANLSAAKLTVGDGTVGGNLKSANYISGLAGWLWRPDGYTELSQAVVRGTIYAAAGAIGGVNISGNGVAGGSFYGYAWPASGGGFYLGPEGLLLGRYYSNRYFQVTADGDVIAPGLSISSGTAIFSGQLSAATGTFSGSLTAAAINAINTINIAGDAVTTHSMSVYEYTSHTSFSAVFSMNMAYAGQFSVIAFLFPYGSFAGGRVDVDIVLSNAPSGAGWSSSGPVRSINTGTTMPVSMTVTAYTPGYYEVTVFVTLTGVGVEPGGQRGGKITGLILRKYR